MVHTSKKNTLYSKFIMPGLFYMYGNVEHDHHVNTQGLRSEVGKILQPLVEGEHGHVDIDHVTARLMSAVYKTQFSMRFRKGSRIIAVAYSWETVDNARIKLSIQIARFVNRTGYERCKKSRLGETALARLQLKPITFHLDVSNFDMVSHRNIRRWIHANPWTIRNVIHEQMK